MQDEKPKLMVLGTGGTIAGEAASSTSTGAYKSAVASIERLLAAVPEIAEVASIRGEQVLQIGSESFNNERLVLLAQTTSAYLKDPDVDGVVIVHGTDTMEETAYFLNLTLKSDKPVVLVGSMRPGSALSADGPLNIYNAVVVAANKSSRAKGVLVVMNDEIHSGRDVTKGHSLQVNTFHSLYGPLGMLVNGTPRYYRLLSRPHTLASQFDIDSISDLPEVNIVFGHGNMSGIPYDAFIEAGTRAIIHMGFGNGSVPDYLKDALKNVRSKGGFIVRATRTGAGAVVRNGAINDDEEGFLVVDDQGPAKARILMALALTQTEDLAELQQAFYTY